MNYLKEIIFVIIGNYVLDLFNLQKYIYLFLVEYCIY